MIHGPWKESHSNKILEKYWPTKCRSEFSCLIKRQSPYKKPTYATCKRGTSDTPKTDKDIIRNEVENDSCQKYKHLCARTTSCWEYLKINLHQKIEKQEGCRIEKNLCRNMIPRTKKSRRKRLSKNHKETGHHNAHDREKFIAKCMYCSNFLVIIFFEQIGKDRKEKIDPWQ